MILHGLISFLLICTAFALVAFVVVRLGLRWRNKFRQQLAAELAGRWNGDTLTCEVEGLKCSYTVGSNRSTISVQDVGSRPQVEIGYRRQAGRRATEFVPDSLLPEATTLQPPTETLRVLRPGIREKFTDLQQIGCVESYLWCDGRLSVTLWGGVHHSQSSARAVQAAARVQRAMQAPCVEWSHRCEEESGDPDIQLAVYRSAARALGDSEIRQIADRLAPSAAQRVAVRMLRDASDHVAGSVALQIVADPTVCEELRLRALLVLNAAELPHLESAIREVLVRGGLKSLRRVALMLAHSCSVDRLESVRLSVDNRQGQLPVPLVGILVQHATGEDEERLLALAGDNRSEIVEVIAAALGRMGSAGCVGPLNAVLSASSAGRQAKNALSGAIAEIQERAGAVAGGLALANPVGAKGGLSMTESLGGATESESEVAEVVVSAEEQA